MMEAAMGRPTLLADRRRAAASAAAGRFACCPPSSTLARHKGWFSCFAHVFSNINSVHQLAMSRKRGRISG